MKNKKSSSLIIFKIKIKRLNYNKLIKKNNKSLLAIQGSLAKQCAFQLTFSYLYAMLFAYNDTGRSCVPCAY